MDRARLTPPPLGRRDLVLALLVGLGAALLLAPGASPEPFLAAWAEAGRELSDVRLAAQLPEAAVHDPAPAVERILATLPGSSEAGQLDVILPLAAAGPVFAALLGAVKRLREVHPRAV